MSAAALLALFAQTPKRTTPFLRQTEDWIVVGLLAGVLLAGAFVLHTLDRWRRRGSDRTRDAADDLTDYRGMFERGEITQAEYEKLRGKVAARAKPPAPPTAHPAAAPQAPPEPPPASPPPA